MRVVGCYSQYAEVGDRLALLEDLECVAEKPEDLLGKVNAIMSSHATANTICRTCIE